MAEIAPAALKWLGSQIGPELGGTLSGIIGDSAHRRGYHRGRNYVYSTDYSVQLTEDKKGDGEAACAIDMSFSASKMKLYTGRLKAAADRNDPRLRYFREFYGTLNGTTVYGRTHKGSGDGTWESSTSDTSHLWHIHISVLRQYANTLSVMQGLLSVLKGVALNITFGSRILEEGMSGPDVIELQERLNHAGANLTVDGEFGPATTTSVKTFQSTKSLTVDGIVGPATATALKAVTTSTIIEGFEDVDANQVFDATWKNDRLLNPYGDKATNPTIAPQTAILNMASDLLTIKSELIARDEADKVRDSASTAAIQALTEALNKALSGTAGSIDSAPIINAVQTAANETKTKVTELQAQVADLRARLAAAAQAESVALNDYDAQPR